MVMVMVLVLAFVMAIVIAIADKQIGPGHRRGITGGIFSNQTESLELARAERLD